VLGCSDFEIERWGGLAASAAATLHVDTHAATEAATFATATEAACMFMMLLSPHTLMPRKQGQAGKAPSEALPRRGGRKAEEGEAARGTTGRCGWKAGDVF
jgi:hypothetical protein